MLTEDLARLKELDLTTYEAAHSWYDNIVKASMGEPSTGFGKTRLSMAILQHCLQEAITAHDGWTYSVFRVPGEWNYCADVSKTGQGYDGDCWNELHEYLLAEKHADTPAAALLAAYIAALEA